MTGRELEGYERAETVAEDDRPVHPGGIEGGQNVRDVAGDRHRRRALHRTCAAPAPVEHQNSGMMLDPAGESQ